MNRKYLLIAFISIMIIASLFYSSLSNNFTFTSTIHTTTSFTLPCNISSPSCFNPPIQP